MLVARAQPSRSVAQENAFVRNQGYVLQERNVVQIPAGMLMDVMALKLVGLEFVLHKDNAVHLIVAVNNVVQMAVVALVDLVLLGKYVLQSNVYEANL